MASTTPNAHRDHTQWQNESAMWRDDIEMWRNEHKDALLKLNAAMVSHNEALGNHLASIEEHANNVSRAEHLLAEDERALNPEKIPRNIDDIHQHEQEEQTKLGANHERIKRHHYATMARLGVLVEALGASM